MKASFLAVILTAAILSTLSLAAPAVSAQEMTAFQCMATSVVPGSTQATVYVSQLLPMDASQRAALTGAWSKFIQANYHLASLTSALCNPFGTDAATQQRVLAAEANAWQKSGLHVVQVTWRPGQAPAADPAAAAAPAPAPKAPEPPANQGPPPRASYCYSDDKKPTVYFSDAFDTAELPASSAWSTGFTKFLAQKYAYKGTVTCKDHDTISSSMSAILEQKDALNGKELIDTDWTYEPPSPAADSGTQK
jgi:hypothetical protein